MIVFACHSGHIWPVGTRRQERKVEVIRVKLGLRALVKSVKIGITVAGGVGVGAGRWGAELYHFIELIPDWKG